MGPEFMRHFASVTLGIKMLQDAPLMLHFSSTIIQTP